jgi:beta-glucosidase/6-phospho-beta-glucosidase/beta-galactosidase
VLRVVAFRKAILAGVAGAFVWEALVRLLALLGVPVFDLVRALGTLAFPNGSMIEWWPPGVAAHLAVGAAWALFYAYFVWARLRWAPALQGLAFAALPALLAIFVMVPQLGLMHLDQSVTRVEWRTFLVGLEPSIVGTLVFGHALFGLTVGAIYTHPVGYRVGSTSSLRLAPRRNDNKAKGKRHGADGGFIFATGIECSYPIIENGKWRRDEMAATHHYELWPKDFELAREVEVTHIRYGPPLHLIFTGPGQYDWSWTDEPMRDLEEFGPDPIVDLCHFGVPTWLGNFQNEELVAALGEYAAAFAKRYPWVRFYTPVNEMYVCARYSALDGLWNEQERSEAAFVRAALNLARASIVMTDAILRERPDAVFVNSESSEFSQPCCPDPEIQRIADFENERRFLPLDLIYSHDVSPHMRDYLREHGVTDKRYDRFMASKPPPRAVLGIDYYEWNERLIDRDGHPQSLGELFGWYVIANQYWERYGRTMMHTETNRRDAAEASRWLWRQWHNVQLLRSTGVPIIGFTWYSLIDQIDWNRGIVDALGVVFPVGLFDLNRDPRPVGLSYKQLIEMHRGAPEYCECKAMKELLA